MKKLILTLFALVLIPAILWAVPLRKVLDGVTANSNSSSYEWPLPGARGVCGNLIIEGTWDTATVALQKSLDGGTTWTVQEDEDGTDQSWTDDVEVRICVPGRLLRLNVSSVGASTDLDAWLVGDVR